MGIFVPPITIAVAAAAAFLAAVIALWAARGGPAGRRRFNPAILVWALAAAYALSFSAASLARHAALATHGFDLGWYGNVIYQFGIGHPFEQTLYPGQGFNNHFQPLVALLAGGARIFRDPAYLLPLQAAIIAAGIPLVYFIAKPAEGPRWPAAALALAFALAPGLHAANLYDFHPRAFAVPLALAAFYFFSRRRFTAGLLFTILLALGDDEPAFHAIALAVWGGFACGRRRAGIIAAAALAAYSLGIVNYLYPKLTYAREGTPFFFPTYFREGGAEGGGVWSAFAAPRGAYIGMLLLPAAAFLPAAGGALITLITPLAVPALATKPTVFQLGWQYPLAILPFVWGAAAAAVGRWTRAEVYTKRKRVLAAAAAFAVTFQLALIILLYQSYYRPVLAAAWAGPRERALATAAAAVPADAAICSDDIFLARLAHRRYCYAWYGAAEAGELPAPPEVLLVDRRAHPPFHFPAICARARAWGLRPAAVTADYVYYDRSASLLTDEDVFAAWYREIGPWQAESAAGDNLVADPLAPRGEAARVRDHLRITLAEGYVFPPGRYDVAFQIRNGSPTAARVTIHTSAVPFNRPGSPRTFTSETVITPADRYQPAAIALRLETPARLVFNFDTTAPVFFGGGRLTSPAFRLATMEHCARTAEGRRLKERLAREAPRGGKR